MAYFIADFPWEPCLCLLIIDIAHCIFFCMRNMRQAWMMLPTGPCTKIWPVSHVYTASGEYSRLIYNNVPSSGLYTFRKSELCSSDCVEPWCLHMSNTHRSGCACGAGRWLRCRCLSHSVRDHSVTHTIRVEPSNLFHTPEEHGQYPQEWVHLWGWEMVEV
jgi:hypothetical protein